MTEHKKAIEVLTLELEELRQENKSLKISYNDAVIKKNQEEEKTLRVEEELKESEVHFRHYFENAPVGINGFDSEGKVISVNSVARKYFGVSENDPLSDYRLFEDPAISDETKRKIRCGQIATEERYIDFREIKQHRMYNTSKTEKDGIYIKLIYTPYGADMKNPDGFIVIIQDITEQKNSELQFVQAKEEAEENRRLLNEIGKIGKVGGWEFNIDTLKQVWTEETYLIHEVDFNHDPNVENGINFFTPTSRPIIEEAIDRAIKFGEPYDLELEIITAKNNLRNVHAIGKVDVENRRVYGFIQDITERKQAEKELQQLSQFNQEIVNSVQEGIIVYDHNMKYLLWNSFLENFTGIPANKVIGKHPLDLFPFHKDNGVIEMIKNAFDGKTTISLDFPFTIPSTGKSGWASDSTAPLYDSTGEIIGAISTVHDITARKQAEKQKEKQVAELAAINRELEQYEHANKELKQFAYIASHQLKEPLRTIANFIQIINEDYSAKMDEELVEYLQTIDKSVERMSILIGSLSHFSQLGTNKKLSNVDCKDIIDSVLTDLEAIIISSNASIEVSEMPKLNVYEIEFRQIFQNLIVNAIKFQKKGTHPEIQIKAEKIKDTYQFSVSDNGIGIDPIHFERIFYIFNRLHNTEEAFEGKGVGLAYCKKIVQLHKGDIWLESELGKGSTFYFTIPILAL